MIFGFSLAGFWGPLASVSGGSQGTTSWSSEAPDQKPNNFRWILKPSLGQSLVLVKLFFGCSHIGAAFLCKSFSNPLAQRLGDQFGIQRMMKSDVFGGLAKTVQI